MKFEQFSPILGNNLTIAEGQLRYGFACNTGIDLYDLTSDKYWKSHPYPGNQLIFYDFQTKQQFEPLQSKENQFFFSIIFQDDCFYFLQAKLDENELILFKYSPGQEVEIVHQMTISGINTYNLSLVHDDSKVWIASFDDKINFYYPQKFSVDNEPSQNLYFIAKNQLYFEQDSDFYSDNEYEHTPDRIVIKNFEDEIISNFQGNLILLSNGKWQKVSDNEYLQYMGQNSPLAGQDRYWVTISDYTQFEDLRDDYWKTRIYPGNYLTFYDQITGKTFSPFTAKPNICYDEPIFNDGYFYFLQVDIKQNKLNIIKYQPRKEADTIFTTSLNLLNLNSLYLIQNNNDVQLISEIEGDPNAEEYMIKGYFPEEFTLTSTINQTPLFIKDHQMYLSDKVLNFNDNNDVIKAISYIITKDLDDKLISKNIGAYTLAPDGKWWLS